MKKFIFIMQHQPTIEQVHEAGSGNREIVELKDKSLLIVPDDPDLERAWFAQRAGEIVEAVGGVVENDTVHVMGQQQLAMAVSMIVREAGAVLVESVTPRASKDIPQPDGSVKKENVFTFKGFRFVHEYCIHPHDKD